MDAVTILAPEPYTAILAARLRPLGRLDEHENGNLALSGSSDYERVYLYPNPLIWNELAPEEVSLYRSVIVHPVLYSMDFVDVGFCRKALIAACDDERLFLDNDFGLFMPARQYVRLLRAHPDWDWKRDPAPPDE